MPGHDSERPLGLMRGETGFAAALADGLFNSLEAALGTASASGDRAATAEPDAIVFPENEADLVEIVRSATENGQRLAVRSGGHSWVASSVRGDGLLVDLAAFDHLALDVAARTATVGPAVRGAQLSSRLAAAGLAFPVGHCGNPGVGGYLLGGGLGVNWGHWLPACFSVTRVRVVTAEGRVLDATATENADWFWLARGAGPGFPGIVTEFDLTLQPLPGAIRVSTWQFPLAELDAVAAWITDASSRLPSNVEVSLVTAGAGRPGAAGPGEPHPLVVSVAATVFADDVAEATMALEPLRASVPPALTLLDQLDAAPVAFDELHVPADATYPEGARYLADTFWTDLDLRDAVAPLAALMERAPSGESYVLTGMPANGRGAELLPRGEAAYGMHDRTLLIVYVVWRDPADDAANRAWLDEVADALLPTTTGHFLSESDIRHSPSRVARSFTYADRDRVERLRAELDPTALFHGYPGESRRA
ncbi:FAD-binding oxidoreductase [Herbiconiux ginsengi]|uniref:FAD/FMN-containing dehydrogenase n=1 Tax=Herbiconiux ginsengi TaxID=381665 RepID=A0A1H3TSI6_9MICO|nr:FAD-binding oxidoreductase [Herbiconiux ginsengi]SDZ53213.1 FAD/FMN-containing dehydrogenase [Herbiconiux ginsengi]